MFLRISLRLFTFMVVISCVFFAATIPGAKSQIVSDQGENVTPAPEAPSSGDGSENEGGGADGGDGVPVPAPGPGFTPDDTPVRPVQPRPSKPRFNRFNRWMKVLNEFFSQGNWLNGGPDNLMEYIGRTLTRLMDILLNRDGIDSVTTSELFGENAPAARGRVTAAAGVPSGGNNKNQLTVADLLKMIPQDRLNLPADRFFS